MQCTYNLRTDIFYDEQETEFTVLGITANDSSGITLDLIPNIFFDKVKCEKFIFLCNSKELDLIHLNDIIDDQLISF